MANSASSDSTPSFGGHTNAEGAAGVRAAPAQVLPVLAIVGTPAADEVADGAGTEIIEIVRHVRPRSSSAVNPTSAPGNTPAEHYNISSRSPQRHTAGPTGLPTATLPSSAAARPSSSGIGPESAATEPSQPVSYGPVRSNNINTVANDVLSRAVNPSDNTAISTTDGAGSGGVGTSPFGNANPRAPIVAQDRVVVQVPIGIQPRAKPTRTTSAPITAASRAVNPSDVVAMDASSTASKRVAETPLEKGRGRSPRADKRCLLIG
jgi:hypothetical protein